MLRGPISVATVTVALGLLGPLSAQRLDLGKRGFQSSSELVTSAVTVRDRAGRLVSTLDQSGFSVEEDGAPQPITQFTRERLPVSLVLAIDTSDSMRGDRFVVARAALMHFLEELLRPDDEVAIISFNHAPQVVARWTTDRIGLRAPLDALAPSGGTAVYDAVAAALPLFNARTYTRAAMVLVSDGADNASDITPTELKQALVNSDVFLYSVAIDTGTERPSARVNPLLLAELTAQGGGYSEVIRSAADLGAATARIADELSHQYLLGYVPTTPDNGRYHTVRVKVSNSNYVVRARRGVIR